MSTGHPQSRLRRALIFLAVVWSIGAGFLALQSVFLHLTDFSLSHLVPAKMGLPNQSPAGAAHCREVTQKLPATPPATASKYKSWSLGFQLGFASEMSNAAKPTDKLMADAQAVARTLGVPDVALPQGHMAYAIRDFNVALAEDPQCVSAALTARYSPQHAALYKFGAAVGLVMVYRTAIPNSGSVLEPEIKTYGQAAGIPPALWQPLLENRVSALPPLVSKIDSYVKTLD